MMRAVLGGAVAFALALGGATAASADDTLAADPGSISGAVTRDDDGSAVAGVTVTASGAGGAWATAVTDDNGAYTLGSLAADSYIVTFIPEGSDLKREYWENTFDYAAATAVVVGATAVSGVDAALAAGASITGTVTREDDGAPLENVGVQALDERNEIVGATQTDAAGDYSLGGLPAGTYRIRFGTDAPDLLSEFWNDAYSFGAATPVTLTEQQALEGIDASLSEPAYVSGTITRSDDGTPVDGFVNLDGVDVQFDSDFIHTQSDGSYRTAVPPGTYRVLFRTFTPGLILEYWKDAGLWDNATLLTVAAGEEASGISAALDRSSQISGTVTVDSDKERTVVVEAWSDGVQVDNITANTGAYSFVLPKGSYILQATATFADGTPPVTQFYKGGATAEEATSIPLSPGDDVPGIDFALTVDAEPDPDPEPEAAITLASGSVEAGNDIAVSGTGFSPGERYAFELRSDPIALGTLTADASGVLKGSFRIPARVPAGAHTLVALSGTTVVATVALQVTAAGDVGGAGSGSLGAGGTGGALANTGSDAPVAAAMAALVLLLAGLTLVRRRRVMS
ncbi:Cna protein B-type domain protein [Microbacterium sp. SA39]|nr:Cna protein B-type domain protein [Microbacterium sp. SA39]